jgi:MinD superfamily P-loop ATPase
MQDVTPVVPEFSDEKCNQCGICEDLCPYGAIKLDKSESKPSFDLDKCYGCGWCVGHCPQWAIKMVKRETGELIWDGKGVIKDWVSDEEGY